MQSAFALHPGTWRSWQMLPGYFGPRMTPYCSPVYIQNVTPLKTGKGVLRLAFFNALYAEGVRDFQVELRILKRASNYLLAELPDDPERSAVIGHIEFSWLGAFCPSLVAAHPPSSFGSVQMYLDEVFGSRQSGMQIKTANEE